MTFSASLKVQGRRAAGVGGRHADEGREPAEGDDLLTPPVVSALKKKYPDKETGVTRADRNRGRWEQDR